MKLTTEGKKSTKNPQKSTIPFCQTINVVISPNGENAPPALALTTMFIQANITKRELSPPTAITTAHINRAVVKLSAMGEIKNAKIPVIQNNALNP